MLTIPELFDRNSLARQGATLAVATQSVIARRADAERELERIRALMPQRPGATPAPRRAGLTAAEIEIKRLQAAAVQPRFSEPPAPAAPLGSLPDVGSVRAQRQALNDWSREQALTTAAKMREQAGGWGR